MIYLRVPSREPEEIIGQSNNCPDTQTCGTDTKPSLGLSGGSS